MSGPVEVFAFTIPADQDQARFEASRVGLVERDWGSRRDYALQRDGEPFAHVQINRRDGLADYGPALAAVAADLLVARKLAAELLAAARREARP